MNLYLNERLVMNNYNRIALAAALAVSIFYSIFALLFTIWPQELLKLVAKANLLKTLEPLQIEVSINNYILGVILHFVIVYIVVWLIGFIYTALSRNKNNY